MTDLIVFNVKNNRYALKIENIQRIIQAVDLTNIPNSNYIVDGIMNYEDSVIKVLNFRKLIGLDCYESELKVLFEKLQYAHILWVDALKTSIETGSEFTKTTNPNMCELGKWIDNFTSFDDRVSTILNELIQYHKQLHTRGGDALEIYKTDKVEAKRIFDMEISYIYEHTIGALDNFIKDLDIVSNSLQKLLIYENEGKIFAIKVDTIEDIAHIEESQIMNSDDEANNNELLELDGILDLNGVLINVIKTINLPS